MKYAVDGWSYEMKAIGTPLVIYLLKLLDESNECMVS